MNRRVVVTGMGAVTPVGIGVEKFWKSLVEGKCGIDKIQRFNPENVKSSLSGEVLDFDPLQYQDVKDAAVQVHVAYAGTFFVGHTG